MTPLKIVGIALIVAGALGFVYGGFSYTRDTSKLKLGPVEVTVQEKRTVNVPLWLGLGAVAVGAALLAFGSRKG